LSFCQFVRAINLVGAQVICQRCLAPESLLGGYHNLESDRLVAGKGLEIPPDYRLASQANRAFLRRAVRFLAEQGVGQFLNICSGLPTVGNVHMVAQMANPAARVVCVDLAPVAVAHSRIMLHDDPNATVIRADAREPNYILMIIADDGVGFDPAQPTMLDGQQGWGLITMAERAEAAGGRFQVESRSQQGTCIIVEVIQ
jgi:hypothetical protein